jgi:hypothetical protein
MSLVILTGIEQRPSVRGNKDLSATPKTLFLESEKILNIDPKKNSVGTVVGSSIAYGDAKRTPRKYTVAERPQEVSVAQNSLTTNVYAPGKDLAVTAASNVIGSATQLSKYLNQVTAATVTTAIGVKLPSASGELKAVVVINAASTAVSVFPTASESIGAAASNVAVSVAAGSRKNFSAYSATNWKVASE